MAFPVSSFVKSFLVGVSLCATPIMSSSVMAADEAESKSQTLRVTIDRAKVVRIAKAADTVIIGNPSVVDATIQDSRTLVLTGRNFGTTNLIILDAEGDAIVDEEVTVVGHEANLVRVYRRNVRETLTCSPICENTVTVGDEKEDFNRIAGQIQQRNDLASGK